MPRILVVTAGLPNKPSALADALIDLYGAEVLPGKASAEGNLDRVLLKLGVAERFGTNASNIRQLNHAILARDFDILFVIKGNFVTAKTLRALKLRPVPPKIIGWSPDDIALSHNNSPILKAAAPYYDTFYTAKSLNIANGELEAMGFSNPMFIHQGFDRNFHRPMPNPASRFAGLASFVGFGEQDRFEKLNHLAKNGIRVDVWGNGWTAAMRAAAHDQLVIHAYPIFGLDYIDALSNSAISFCFLRKLNRDVHTSRTFEIPACGGFMLAERTDEHLQYFEEDTEAVYFGDADELLEKTRIYLSDSDSRNAIAAAGRQRCLDSDYSYHRLVKQMIESE